MPLVTNLREDYQLAMLENMAIKQPDLKRRLLECRIKEDYITTLEDQLRILEKIINNLLKEANENS